MPGKCATCLYSWHSRTRPVTGLIMNMSDARNQTHALVSEKAGSKPSVTISVAENRFHHSKLLAYRWYKWFAACLLTQTCTSLIPTIRSVHDDILVLL